MPPFLTIRLLTVAALLAASLHAQTHRVAAPENVTRSVGVYEWTGDLAKPTAARLVPVSLFIDGAFQQGGTYYARPIPLALLNGNIYSLEKAGVAEGTVTLDYARHLQATASDNASDPLAADANTTGLGWFGYGTFAALPAPRKVSALHASANIQTIVSSKDDSNKDNDRPTFANKKSDDTKTSGSSKKSEPSASVTPIASDDDPDRPHLSKAPSATSSTPAGTPDPSSTPTEPTDSRTTTTTKDPADDNDRPTLRHRDPKQAAADRKVRSQSSVSATPGSLNDDPDRPNMRRGRAAGIGGAPAPQLTGIPATLHQIVAISDPTTREPHPFARDWATPTERADVLAKLEVIARQQLALYARNNGAGPSTTTTPTSKPVSRPVSKPSKRPAPAARGLVLPHPPAVPTGVLTGEDLTPYTLSYGGLPTFVYTASSPPPAGSLTLPERYITLVAQQLPSGELQLAFATVTDAAHLDRTPWFRLVDAVDPNAEHRASLLFELRGHSSRQFALYRVLSAKAEQQFTTEPIQ
ncbi:MAG: hypothetical protein ABI147_03670 [Acidobacteriaceae bacterium]